MHLLLKHDVLLDNVRNLRQLILRYTVRNSLISFVMSHFIECIWLYNAVAILQFETKQRIYGLQG